MRRLHFMVLLSGVALSTVGYSLIAYAVQLADGTVYFNHPPSLISASTTSNWAAYPNAVYYFDLQVPNDAGESLQTVTITQNDGDSFLRHVEFETDETQAFLGTEQRQGEEVAIATSSWDSDTATITITLADPIAPGTDITFRLTPEYNPRLGGIYLFGVTAYPAGNETYGQFLGYGRMHFYDRHGG